MPESLISEVSVTERYTFRECRRQWYLGSVLKLEPKVTPFRYFFGTGWHVAMQAYHEKGGTVDAAQKTYVDWYQATEPDIRENYGFLWPGVEQEYHDAFLLTQQMIHNYDSFHKTGEMWETISVEQRVWVPILHPQTRRALPGRPRLTARLDLLGYSTMTRRKGVIIVDHKTAAQSPSTGRDLDIDDQLTGYAYVYWRLTGVLPELIIYNTAIKRVPTPPEILKSGLPSKAKGQSTTYGMYLELLKSLQVSKPELNLKLSDYTEVLSALRNEGWGRYFVREGVTRNLYQLEAFEEHLYFELKDMREVAADSRKAYPSPSPQRCGSCSYIAPCMAMEDGSDAETLLENRFIYNPEPRW